MDASLLKTDSRTETCAEHGEYTSRLYIKFWSKCPKCTDAVRLAERAESDARAKAKKAAAQTARANALKLSSGLVGRQFDSTFDNFEVSRPEQGDVLAACREYVQGFAYDSGNGWTVPLTSLWLIGPPGGGKSHLGAAMVNHLNAELKAGARMHSAREIIRLLRSTWSKDNPPHTPSYETELGYVQGRAITEEMMIEDLGNAPLLVLDEVGVSFGSDAEHVQLFDVLDLRYRLQLPTVLLSNLKTAELKSALGDRVFDRLREGATVRMCSWASYRGEFARRVGGAV